MSMWMMRRVWGVTEQLRCHEVMEMFQRLAEGHAARITVVTPNLRISRVLTSEFDSFQVAKGLTVWEAPDILPFGAFVERLWEDALYSELGDKLPLLLTPAQEQLLWEQILEGSDLLILPQAAAQCREAWRLLHQWRVGAGRGNEDHSAFSEWVTQYQKETPGDIDSARLPDLVAGLLDELKKPKLLVAYAFDVLPPQTAEFLRHFEFVEVKPEAVQGSSFRTSFASAKEELETAARWARARLEEGRARLLARHAAGPPPARRAEGAAALQRLARRAALELPVGRCRIGFTRIFFPQCGIRKGEQTVALPLSLRRRIRDGAARDARRAPAQESRGHGCSSQVDRLRRAMPASAAGPGKSIRIGGRGGRKVPFRVGAAFLGAARGGGLPGRALARLGGVPDACQVARSAG